MFRKQEGAPPPAAQPAPVERITSVLGAGINWKGSLSGSGGVRIEGSVEGEIDVRGLLVVGEAGRVTCEDLRANVVIVAGAVRGDITAEKVEIRATGRVWGNVVTAAFATEEVAFLRGQIRMEEKVDVHRAPAQADSAPEVENEAAPPAEETGEEAGSQAA